MKRFNLMAALLLFLVILLWFGCSQQAGEEPSSDKKKIEISFLTMQLRPTFDSYFFELFEEYETANPHIKINWLDYPYQNYDTKLMTAFMGKNPPDVINLSTDAIHVYARGNFIRPIDDLLPPEVFDEYFSNMVEEGCRYNDRIYALPWYSTGEISLYNKKIFEEAGIDVENLPKTYEEVRKAAEIIHEKTDKFGIFPTYTEAGSLRHYLLEAGVPLLNEDGTKAAFYTPRAVEVFKFWTDLYKEGLVPSEALTAMHRRPIELYKSGRLAILGTGAVFLKQVKSDAPDIYENTVVGQKLRWKDGGVFFVALHTLALAQKSEHPKEAVEFAHFVTNAENQLKFSKLTTILPSNKEAMADPYFTDVEDTLTGRARKLSAEQAPEAVIVQVPQQSRELFKIFDEITEEVCLGRMSAEEGLKKAAQQWNEVLSQE